MNEWKCVQIITVQNLLPNSTHVYKHTNIQILKATKSLPKNSAPKCTIVHFRRTLCNMLVNEMTKWKLIQAKWKQVRKSWVRVKTIVRYSYKLKLKRTFWCKSKFKINWSNSLWKIAPKKCSYYAHNSIFELAYRSWMTYYVITSL